MIPLCCPFPGLAHSVLSLFILVGYFLVMLVTNEVGKVVVTDHRVLPMAWNVTSPTSDFVIRDFYSMSSLDVVFLHLTTSFS